MTASTPTDPTARIPGAGPWAPAGRPVGARRWPAPLVALGLLLALYLLAPVVILLVHAGSTARTGLAAEGLWPALRISLITASISAAIIALLGIPLAWALARARGRFWDAIGVAVQLPLALPPLMSGILLINIIGPYTTIGRLFGGTLTDSAAGIVLAQTFVAAPFLIVAARSAFAAVDAELLDVAATLGHGEWSRFARVSLPLAAPGIRAGLLLSWLRAFGEFGATVIVAYHPYSLPVLTFTQFSSTGVPGTLAPTLTAIAAAALVLVLARLASGRRTWRAARDRLAAGSQRLAHAPAGTRPPAVRSAGATLDFDLRAHAGSFALTVAHTGRAPRLALLGPSGAGKSLTLRCLAGLRGIDVGRVTLGDRELAGLSAERRRIGWVPQGAPLMPHLTVWRQVMFGVGADPGLAARWLEALGLAELSDRLPHQLSGGQRQRVALARALACAPDLILLDEPFSSLDRPVRDELARLLRRVQLSTGLPSVLVTHDPEEAALLADEVVVLSEGAALQAGEVARVFAHPNSSHVARLLGIENVRAGRMASPGRLLADGCEFAVAADGPPPGTPVMWCVRPEQVIVRCDDDGSAMVPAGPPDAGVDGLAATALDAYDLGTMREVVVRVEGGVELTARMLDGRELRPGDRCEIAIAPEAITVWADGAARRASNASVFVGAATRGRAP